MNVIVGKNIGKSYFPWNNLRESIVLSILSTSIFHTNESNIIEKYTNCDWLSLYLIKQEIFYRHVYKFRLISKDTENQILKKSNYTKRANRAINLPWPIISEQFYIWDISKVKFAKKKQYFNRKCQCNFQKKERKTNSNSSRIRVIQTTKNPFQRLRHRKV